MSGEAGAYGESRQPGGKGIPDWCGRLEASEGGDPMFSEEGEKEKGA